MSVARRMAAAVAAMLFAVAPASATDSPAAHREPTREELLERLAPPPAATRSLRNLVPVEAKVDLTVHFDFDSDRVQPRSVPLLERLASAMQDPRLAAQRFRIEGHTDAVGRAAYNAALSRRRADAVAAMLAGLGVTRDRVETVGMGSEALADPDNPRSGVNRRVVVVTLGR